MASKSGYINVDENEEENIDEPKLSNSVSISKTGSMYQFYA